MLYQIAKYASGYRCGCVVKKLASQPCDFEFISDCVHLGLVSSIITYKSTKSCQWIWSMKTMWKPGVCACVKPLSKHHVVVVVVWFYHNSKVVPFQSSIKRVCLAMRNITVFENRCGLATRRASSHRESASANSFHACKHRKMNIKWWCWIVIYLLYFAFVNDR